jgi:hypothetical protein
MELVKDAVARYVPKAEIDARIQELEIEEKFWEEHDEIEASEKHVVM